MEIYRIQSLKKESLWYSFDGKFEDKIKSITGQSIPMPWEEFRQLDDKIKLLSSVKDIQMFPHWFSEEQINKLFNSGYSLYKYDVPEIIELPKGECLFDYNKVNSCEEIQSSILDVFYS